MKTKWTLALSVLMVFGLIMVSPAAAETPYAIVNGAGTAECPLGMLFDVQFQISVPCDPGDGAKGFVRVTDPFGSWFKANIERAAAVDAPVLNEPTLPLGYPEFPMLLAFGENRWAAFGPHSSNVLWESVITLQGQAVWAYGTIVATNNELWEGQEVLFGVLSKDQNGGGVPDYLFVPLCLWGEENACSTLPSEALFGWIVDYGVYDWYLYFWMGLDQGHVLFVEEPSID